MNTKRSRRAPVVLAGRGSRRRARQGPSVTDAEAQSEPLPGPMLVLLSRLHRSEQPPGDESEPGRDG